MKIIKEFKEFAVKGNMIDLAVGIIIGVAFGKIIASLVSDIIMPPIGLLLGGLNFTDIQIIMKDAVVDPVTGKVTAAVALKIGNFFQTLVDFLIIAFSVFMILKGIIGMKKKKIEEPPAVPAPPVPTKDQELLSEIRDILKNK
jgi:large conductance mechanosensitive channel